MNNLSDEIICIVNERKKKKIDRLKSVCVSVNKIGCACFSRVFRMENCNDTQANSFQ